MIVECIRTGNAYRNFNYLIACPETGEALAIDALDHEAMVAATGARLLAYLRAAARVAVVDRGAKAGDIIKVGKQVEPE